MYPRWIEIVGYVTVAIIGTLMFFNPLLPLLRGIEAAAIDLSDVVC
jgi:hypothetical protein